MKILPEQAATLAQSVDGVSIFVFWICMISFVIVMAMVIGFPLIYRRKTDNDETPDIRGSHLAEALWTIIPTVLCMVIFGYGMVVYDDMRAIPDHDEVLEVQVTGRKWQWIFTYPDGRKEPNTMTVPVDTDVRLVMKSDDVIHSFYVPAFRIKQDVLPNQYSKLWFNATEEGEFQTFCTEYCGTDHSAMLAKVHVVSKEEYDAWMNAGAAAAEAAAAMPPEELGQQVFAKYGCSSCHSITGAAGVGPALNGVFGKNEKLVDGTEVLVDENYLQESVYEPTVKVVEGFSPIMPPFKGMVNEAEMAGLIAYIKSLQ